MKSSTNVLSVMTFVITILAFLFLIITKVSIAMYIALTGFLVTTGLLLPALWKQQKMYKGLSCRVAELLEKVAGGQDSLELAGDKALLERLSIVLADLDEAKLQL